MNTEIEVKFLRVDPEELRKKLQAIGADCQQPMRLMHRAMIDYPDLRLKNEHNAFIRVRDEGDKVSLTYKEFSAYSVDGAKEIETSVGSFEETIKLFERIGLVVRSLQESKRETWQLEGTEIVIDQWPWLDPYIEIEGASEADIRNIAARLDLQWEDAVFGSIMVAYRAQYPYLKKGDGRAVGNLPLVRFEDPFPDLLKDT